jgi:hypothetical protein
MPPMDWIYQNTWRLFARYETSHPQRTFTLLKQPVITFVEIVSRSQLDDFAWQDHLINSAWIILFVIDEMNWPNCLISKLTVKV